MAPKRNPARQLGCRRTGKASVSDKKHAFKSVLFYFGKVSAESGGKREKLSHVKNNIGLYKLYITQEKNYLLK
ncbi:MAG TPA: hypothetical protein DF364_04385 [Ruminococcaceae bacterium]|nr:hypothetical protein [Oscillospiraceae bacterium]